LSSLRRLVYCLRVLCLHGSGANPARGDTMHTLQQSSEVVATAAVAASDAPEVLVFVLAAVAVAAVVDPQLYRDSV